MEHLHMSNQYTWNRIIMIFTKDLAIVHDSVNALPKRKTLGRSILRNLKRKLECLSKDGICF